MEKERGTESMNSETRFLIMDVDGSLTDGRIYMGPSVEAMKAFSIKDGYAINSILKPSNINVILSANSFVFNETIVKKKIAS